MLGSIKKLSSIDDVDEIKDSLYHYEYNEKRSYTELLFGSMTGITGVMLLFIILLMAVTSLKAVRRRCFQIFGVIHMVGFPLFFSLIMIHGLHFWFNWGIPFALILTLPGFAMLMLQTVLRVFSRCKYKFEIADVNLTSDQKYIMIYFIKPANFRFKHGQFIFINVPSISWFQWHPFTIASTPTNPYLVLMIK